MASTKATAEQIEASIQEITKKGEEPSLDKVREVLSSQGLIIDESVFYKQLYSNHLYDWQTKKRPDELLAEQQAQDKIDELERSLSVVKATLESTEDGIVMISRDGKMPHWNQNFVDMFRFPKEILDAHDERVALKHFLDQVVDPEGLFKMISRLYDDPSIKGSMGDLYFKDGRIFERYSQPYMAGEQIIGRVWSFRDVTARRKQEQDLRLRQRAIEASTHGVIITGNDYNYSIIYINPAVENITGFEMNLLLNQNCFSWCKSSDSQPAIQDLKLALNEKKEKQVILHNYTKEGKSFWCEINISPVPDHQGEINHFVWILTDITQRKKMEDELSHQATHDTLTGLPNRTLLHDRLERALRRSREKNTLVSVLFIDLDRFKLINDSLRHSVGDELLREIAKRLRRSIRKSDTISRIGGDEFVVVTELEKTEKEIIPLADRLLKAIAEPIYLENRLLNITASIGICTSTPTKPAESEVLMKNADIAMYRAKELGRANYQFFTSEMNEYVTKCLRIENDLHKALSQQEFMLHYQPIVNLKTGYIVAVEALLRWNHPTDGLIMPGEYIPIAEESGLIVPIGKWVVEAACMQHTIWQEKIANPFPIAINISSRQLKKDNFIETIDEITDRINVDPSCLQLEITESMILDNTLEIRKTLERLKERGIALLMDDFGTGYSNLSYLSQLPLDKLKIDISFVRGIGIRATDMTLVQTIITMGHNLGLEIVAEGVETLEQLNFLQEHGCDEIQGYYISKPCAPDKMFEIIKKNRIMPSIEQLHNDFAELEEAGA